MLIQSRWSTMSVLFSVRSHLSLHLGKIMPTTTKRVQRLLWFRPLKICLQMRHQMSSLTRQRLTVSRRRWLTWLCSRETHRASKLTSCWNECAPTLLLSSKRLCSRSRWQRSLSQNFWTRKSLELKKMMFYSLHSTWSMEKGQALKERSSSFTQTLQPVALILLPASATKIMAPIGEKSWSLRLFKTMKRRRA